MAELLVRTVDNTLPDPVANLKCWKRGMVITVQPDGWQWGVAELNMPIFMIIKAPQVTLAQASVYLGSLIDPTSSTPDTTNPLRSFSLNLNDPSVLTLIGDGTNRLSSSITLTSVALQALKTSVTIV